MQSETQSSVNEIKTTISQSITTQPQTVSSTTVQSPASWAS